MTREGSGTAPWGIWFVGARGGVATTAVVGALAMRRGLADPVGMMTALPEIAALDLPPLAAAVFGGWEVRPGTLLDEARGVARATGTLREDLLAVVAEDLAACDRRIRPGSVAGCGPAIGRLARRRARGERPAAVFERAAADLDAFRRREGLARVVVVNLASSEPPLAPAAIRTLSDWKGFRRALGRRGAQVPASVLYAAAAVETGCPYVNFTPSAGSGVPALRARARERGVPHMGADGKTGETWLKTVIAPAFLARNLRVLSWEGHNILGDRDGHILSHPDNVRGKIQDKDGALRRILRDPDLHSRVRIDYVPSLDDWKTAWDFVHFQGFLGVKMSLQFIWQGCDAILAAPLVLDLARLAAFAQEAGESGLMTHLACFFKNPWGASEDGFTRQFEALLAYVRRHAGRARPRAASRLQAGRNSADRKDDPPPAAERRWNAPTGTRPDATA